MATARLISRAFLGAAILEGKPVGSYKMVGQYIGVDGDMILRWQLGQEIPSSAQEARLRMLEYVVDCTESLIRKTKQNLSLMDV